MSIGCPSTLSHVLWLHLLLSGGWLWFAADPYTGVSFLRLSHSWKERTVTYYFRLMFCLLILHSHLLLIYIYNTGLNNDVVITAFCTSLHWSPQWPAQRVPGLSSTTSRSSWVRASTGAWTMARVEMMAPFWLKKPLQHIKCWIPPCSAVLFKPQLRHRHPLVFQHLLCSRGSMKPTLSTVGFITFRASLTIRFIMWARHGWWVHLNTFIDLVMLAALSLTQQTTFPSTCHSLATLNSSSAKFSVAELKTVQKTARYQTIYNEVTCNWHVRCGYPWCPGVSGRANGSSFLDSFPYWSLCTVVE